MTVKIDQVRIEERVEAILHEFNSDSTRTMMIVDHNALYEACRLQRTPKKGFGEIVSDTLTGHSLCKRYGHFVYTQIDGASWVFVKICKTSEWKDLSASRIADFEDLYKE